MDRALPDCGSALVHLTLPPVMSPTAIRRPWGNYTCFFGA